MTVQIPAEPSYIDLHSVSDKCLTGVQTENKQSSSLCIDDPGGERSGGGRGYFKFSWVCAVGTSEPLPHYNLFLVYFVAKY